MAVRVEIARKGLARKVGLRPLRRKAEKILMFLNQSQAELSIALVGNQEIRQLNARYRNKNRPTDVLSFACDESLPAGMPMLGDVVISVEKAEEQARRRRETLEHEVESLLIHGILHLLGYDHERSQKDAKIMREMEKKVSRALCRTRALRV